ncbi:hypothetical protein DIJ64_04025 [Mycobacterium leprae]|uniref:Uncharacterized protein n=1 Tax=Mycobacterium leprae TaxID=1769 RepID=A0AAD0KR87_MYCLR|nr:hypothetical protein DIJ64_04025 [Mycobacterium leprae]OAR21757.1 hypothetical protein A8144_00730 [Mycobacterium leprae 3125609]OAX72297.1 hypothetical protein A3216_00795 [Mycobacterium leprae 7935681]
MLIGVVNRAFTVFVLLVEYWAQGDCGSLSNVIIGTVVVAFRIVLVGSMGEPVGWDLHDRIAVTPLTIDPCKHYSPVPYRLTILSEPVANRSASATHASIGQASRQFKTNDG